MQYFTWRIALQSMKVFYCALWWATMHPAAKICFSPKYLKHFQTGQTCTVNAICNYLDHCLGQKKATAVICTLQQHTCALACGDAIHFKWHPSTVRQHNSDVHALQCMVTHHGILKVMLNPNPFYIIYSKHYVNLPQHTSLGSLRVAPVGEQACWVRGNWWWEQAPAAVPQ